MRGGPAALTALGSSHGLELYYVFQHTAQITRYAPTPSDNMVESAMLGSWTSMATSGQPNTSSGLTGWTRYDAATDPFMEFGSLIGASQGVRSSECDFWDRVQ